MTNRRPTDPPPDDEPHGHDLGLAIDLSTLVERRHALKLFAGAGVLALAGCANQSLQSATGTSTTTGAAGSGGSSAGRSSSSTSPATSGTNGSASGSATGQATTGRATTPIPPETAGPFPGDGSNGPNALSSSGIVRSDIRSSFGSSTTAAEGVPLTVRLALLDASKGTALAGAAVYLWHCDAVGRYSMYSQGVTDENYLRGVQASADDGTVTFTTIFPGAYSGRWPHMHFEVYPSLDAATKAGSRLTTSQLALPEDACNTVYTEAGYEQSAGNMRRTTLASDMVFSDGWTTQLAAMTGTVGNGLTASLNVPV